MQDKQDNDPVQLEQSWRTDKRWAEVGRPYSAENVLGLRAR